jgi:hypothetical protein
MAFKMQVVSQALRTTPGTQDFTISGFGSSVSAAHVIVSNATVVGTTKDGAALGVGATDGVRQWATASSSADSGSASVSDNWTAANQMGIILNPATGLVDIEFSFNSWITNGIRINVDTNVSGSAPIVGMTLFGGSHATCYANIASGSGTTQDVEVVETGAPIKGHFMFTSFCGPRRFDDTNDSGYRLFSGIALRDLTQLSQGKVDTDAQSTTWGSNGQKEVLLRSWINTGPTSSSVNSEIELTSWTDTGFGWTPRGAVFNSDFGYLIVNHGGVALTALQKWTTPGNSDPNAAETWPQFQPKYLMTLCSDLKAGNIIAVQTGGQSSDEGHGIGITDGVRHALSMSFMDDNLTAANTGSRFNDSIFAAYMANTTGSTVSRCTFKSWDPLGFSYDYNGNTWFKIWPTFVLGDRPPGQPKYTHQSGVL